MQRRTVSREALNAMMYNMLGCTIRRLGEVQYALCTDVLYAREGEYTQYSMQGCTECRDLLCVGNWKNSKPLAFLQLFEMFLSSKKKNLFVTVF